MKPVLYILPVPRFFSQIHGGGGCVAHARGVLEGLAALGYQPLVLTEEPAAALDAVPECRVTVLPCANKSALGRLHWSWQLVRAAARLRREQDTAFAYCRYSAGFTPWLPLLRRALGSIPLVLEVNSLGSQRHSWMKRLDRLALAASDLIVCISEPLRQVVASLLSAAQQERLIVIPNGVDVERFARAEQTQVPVAVHRIGYSGILKPDYGLEDLIAAFGLMQSPQPDTELHLYGDGPYRAELERLAGGLRGVHFHGMIPMDRIPAELQGMDVVVGTTSPRHRFQSPIKLYEYMASGRPIVYAATSQSELALGREERGLLYEIGNPTDLARQINRLLADRKLAMRLGQAAQATARAHHSWQSRVEQMQTEMERRGLLHTQLRTASLHPLKPVTGATA